MNKSIDMVAQLLEKNNIPLPDGAKKKDGGLNFENKEWCQALVDGYYGYSFFIIDLGASRHMDSARESLSALHSYSGPSTLMGDESDIPAKGIGRINLDNGYFNNVFIVLYIEANLLCNLSFYYHM